MVPLFKNFKITNVPSGDFDVEIMGDNQKQLLLVVQISDSFPDELDVFLEKIFQAAGVDPKRDAIILKLPADKEIPFALLKQRYDFKNVVVFGALKNNLGLNFTILPYQLTKLATIHFLFADNLNQIFQERQNGGKKMAAKLWKALKIMFKESMD